MITEGHCTARKTALKSGTAMYLGIATLALASPAWAQVPVQQPPVSEDPQSTTRVEGDEIIVTGSQIRGIEPVGANVVGLDQEAIRATGVGDTNQLLAQIPQSNFFLDNPEPGGTGPLSSAANGAPRVPVSRANLRNIPGTNSGSGSPTLVLLDGRRVVPMGIEQSVVDPGIFPVGILERVEVLLDGSSATYGSDAVAGVINFITRKRFDGTEMTARGGFADNYYSVDASVTHGISWDTGGLVLNYEFSKNSNILNQDRGHETPLNWIGQTGGNFIGFTAPAIDDLACDTANIQNATTGASQAIIYSGAVPARGASFCAANRYDTYIPAAQRHTGFLTFNQEITPAIELSLSAFYTTRKQLSSSGPFTGSVTVRPTVTLSNGAVVPNTNYIPIAEFGLTAPQRVAFSFGPVLGYDAFYTKTVTEAGQISPELKFNLGGDWQVRTSFVWGKSQTSVDQDKLDTTLLASLTAAGNFNPYNVAANSPATLASLVFHLRNDAIQEFTQARIVGDGPLFTLPAGEVRVALGGEWMKTSVRRRITDATTLLLQPYQSASVSSKSLFAEVVVPLVSPEMNVPAINKLTLSLSGRYDDYGIAGHPFNPKIAATYNPVDWITICANWSKSFRAPNAIDKVLTNSNQVRCIGAVSGCTGAFGQPPAAVRPPYAASPNNIYLFLTGTLPDLKPETSKSWSIGADVMPPFVPGLKLSASYWKIDFTNFISSPITSSVSQLFDNPSLYTLSPDAVNDPAFLAAAQAFALQANGGQQLLTFLSTSPYIVRYLADSRVRNLGGAKISGIDVGAQYRRDTGFGRVFGAVNVSIPVKNDFRINPLGNFTDVTRFDAPAYTLTANVGAEVGRLFGQATMRHRPSVTPDPITPRLNGDIPSYTVFDLAFRYDVGGEGPLTKDLELSLNVNNVFDTKPPLAYTAAGGTYAYISNIGRFVQFGVTKKF